MSTLVIIQREGVTTLDDKGFLGHRLKSTREKLRYTQTEAAARIGIHNSTLGKYELGEREPDIETIKKIAKFYDVSPVWIAFGDEKSEPGGDNEKLDLIEQEAARLGLSPNDPDFRDMVLDALKLIRAARGKDVEKS